MQNRCTYGPADMGGDASPAADLLPPLVPPSAIWLSSGGGSVSGTNAQLNLFIGGSVVAGKSTAGQATLNHSAFATDSIQ